MTEAPARPDQPGRQAALRLRAPERRRQLLDAALETFADSGFVGTSMNDVAEAAGVTKPVLYQHFESKEALYRELVTDVGARLEAAFVDGLATATGPRQLVEAGFRAYFRWAVADPSGFRVLFAERNRVDAELAAALARVESVMADRVAALIEVDGLGPEQRQVLAFGIVGMAESTSRHWLSRGLGAGTDADAFADLVARLAWSGLRGIRG